MYYKASQSRVLISGVMIARYIALRSCAERWEAVDMFVGCERGTSPFTHVTSVHLGTLLNHGAWVGISEKRKAKKGV